MNDEQIPATDGPTGIPLPQKTNPHYHILMVDDDKSIRHFCVQALFASGYQVQAAEDGAAAWDVLQINSYNLLITDHGMPKVTGVELLQKLHDAHMALPVIMATGTLPEAEFIQYPWLAPNATLLKPYTTEELLEIVKEVLRATHGARKWVAAPSDGERPPALTLVSHDDDAARQCGLDQQKSNMG
jgi:DNA-binding response OmpR family regulator